MGQPSRIHLLLLADEFIVRGSDTQGSETSQYLQEEKSKEIARVAASESAGAQTGGPAPRGCGTGTWYLNG